MKSWIGAFLLTVGIITLTFPLLFKYSEPAPMMIATEAIPKSAPEFYPGLTGLPIEAPKKDWTEYGDKIVGWVTSLAGTYVLVTNARDKRKKKK